MLLLAAIGSRARAEDTNDPGRGMYIRYCGACHGPDAKGTGVAATVLRPKPSDLTRLSKRQGGFQSARIAAFIDGSTQVRAHGSADMPVWGEVLREDGTAVGSKNAVQSKIMMITEYLKSIQAK